MALAALALLPVFGRKSVVGVQTKQLSNAKQLGTAAKLYAMDNEGRFPLHLAEVEPDYLPSGSFEQLLCEAIDGDKKLPRLKYEWLYFGAFFDEKNPPPLLIASPQAFTADKKQKRVIIRGDGSGSIVNDDEYQQELRKTIDAMHQRAGTPASKPDAALDAVKATAH